MSAPITFTFVCLTDKQVASLVDVQALEEGGHRQHALRLLHDHASALTVEVWRDDVVWEVIGRDGVRRAAGALLGRSEAAKGLTPAGPMQER